MSDDAVRERHGVSCRQDGTFLSSITVWEGENLIYIDGQRDVRNLTPWQARYLAAKLYRLSRRIRDREQQP